MTCPNGPLPLFGFSDLSSNIKSMPEFDPFLFDSITASTTELVPSSTELNIVSAASPNAKLQARVELVAKRLARMPRTFAEQGQTSFIHRRQLEQTCHPALQDAMSACALYCLRGVANQALVFRNLEHRCQQLTTGTNALFSSRTDLLAALQALLLYQMIRLFDGDIRLRAHAEVDAPVAILWASHLRACTSNATQTALVSQTPATTTIAAIDCESDWQSWLVDESVRRTVITTFMLQGVYNFLKCGQDSPPELSFTFTAQAALWSAQSNIAWRKAQEERERLVIQVTRWDEGVAKAKPMDLEELGILVMTMIWGPEATRTWLGKDFTVKYGLDTA